MKRLANRFMAVVEKQLRGWLAPQDALAKRLPRHGVGAEIGVWKGHFSKRLLSIAKPKRLYLVDPWLFQPDFPDNGYGGSGRPFRGILVESQSDMDALFESVKKELGSSPSVEVLRIMSSEMGRHIHPMQLDWIYIDGNHAYEHVKADLEMAWTLVKPGGVIAGDDFNFKNLSSPYGVRTALVEFCNDKDRPIVLIGDSQFLVRS